MTVLLNATFDTDEDGFSAGSRVAGEGADFDTGYLSVPGNTTATRSFTAVDSGIARIDLWLRVDDSETASDTSKDVHVYILPTAGSIDFSNSLNRLSINRRTGAGATASLIRLFLHDGPSTGIESPGIFGRGAWLKVSFVYNFSAKTYDLYYNDYLWLRGLGWSNTSAADLSRIAIVSEASAPATLFDEIRVESDWALPAESTLISDDFTTQTGEEIEDTAPGTDNRNISPQKWVIPEDGDAWGSFTRTASGLQMDSGTSTGQALALARCVSEGTYEATWTVSNTGRIYVGVIARYYGQPPFSDGSVILRYDSGATSGQRLRLQGGATIKAQSNPTGVTITAGGSYTFKLELRGRYAWAYVDDVLQFGGPVLLTDGQSAVSEEYAGPFGISFTADSYCTAFSCTGAMPESSVMPSVGDVSVELMKGMVPEFHHAALDEPQQNLFLGKGIQMGHRGSADIGNIIVAYRTLLDATNVKSYQQRSPNLSDTLALSYSNVYLTVTRRGLWAYESMTVWNNTRSLGIENDFNFRHWSNDYRIVGPTGSGSLLSDTYTDGRTDASSLAMPMVFQRVTDVGAGDQVRFTSVGGNGQNWSGSVHSLGYQGYADHAGSTSNRYQRDGSDLSVGTTYDIFRAILIESGALSLSDSVMTGYRDDTADPMTLTFATGSAKTDADGDLNTDGFNERFGWYEVNAVAGALDTTLVVDGKTRYMPQLRVHGFDSEVTAVTIGGSAATAGVDYWLDDLGDGTALLQLAGNYDSDTQVAIGEAGPVGWPAGVPRPPVMFFD